jgi:hypothetical protein
MNSEVTLENVVQAYEARRRAYQESERTHDFQEWQNFECVRTAISPYLYDNDLEALSRECQVESGQWLEEEDDFKKWSDPNDQSSRVFWLQGIPGAGTFSASHKLNITITRNRENCDVIGRHPSQKSSRTQYAIRVPQARQAYMQLRLEDLPLPNFPGTSGQSTSAANYTRSIHV